jgi:hypothetical protein
LNNVNASSSTTVTLTHDCNGKLAITDVSKASNLASSDTDKECDVDDGMTIDDNDSASIHQIKKKPKLVNSSDDAQCFLCEVSI